MTRGRIDWKEEAAVMIRITITQTPDLVRIHCLGHANYSSRGNDIVCSAVSCLLQTLCHALEELTRNAVNASLKSGNSIVVIHDPSPEARILIENFYIGCREIAKAYNGYVEIIKKINIRISAKK